MRSVLSIDVANGKSEVLLITERKKIKSFINYFILNRY